MMFELELQHFAHFSSESSDSPSRKKEATVFTARCYSERGYETKCRLSVCLSVTFKHRDHIKELRLEFFENNFTAAYLKFPAYIDPNMGDLVE